MVQSQPRQIVYKTLSRKHPSQKGLVEWLKVKALSSSPSTKKKKKKRLNSLLNVTQLGSDRAKTCVRLSGSNTSGAK
jgi:hypothetical protein